MKKANPVFAETLSDAELEELKLAFEESAEYAYEQVNEHRRSYEPLDIENQVFISKSLHTTKSAQLTKDNPRIGVIFGKFYPLHQGHLYMIDRARTECDHLYVFVCSDEKRDEKLFWDSSIPVQPTREVRTAWVKRATDSYDNVEVFNLREDNIPSYPNGWFEWAKVVQFYLDQLPLKPQYVYTSEPQDAENYKYYLDLEAVLVDPNRGYVPISGTACRKRIFDNFKYLPEVVKADVVLNINLDLDDLLRFYGIDKNVKSSELARIARALQHMCRNYGFNFCTPLLDDFAQQDITYSFGNNSPVTITWGNPGPIPGTKAGSQVHELLKTTEQVVETTAQQQEQEALYQTQSHDYIYAHSHSCATTSVLNNINTNTVGDTNTSDVVTSAINQVREQEDASLIEALAAHDAEFASNVGISKEISSWFNQAIGLPERKLTANAFNHYTVRIFSLQDQAFYQEGKVPANLATDWKLIRNIVQAQNDEYYVACALHNKFRYVEHLAPLYLGVTNYAGLWDASLNFLPTGLNFKLSPGLSYKVGIAQLHDLELAVVTVVRTLIARLQEKIPHPYDPMIITRPSEQRMRRLSYCIRRLKNLTAQNDSDKLAALESLATSTELNAASSVVSGIDLTAATAEQAQTQAQQDQQVAQDENAEPKRGRGKSPQEYIAHLEAEIAAYVAERERTGINFLYNRVNPTDPVAPKTYIFNRNQEDDALRSKQAIKYLIDNYINWIDLYSFKLPGFGYITPALDLRPSVEQRIRSSQASRVKEPRLADKWQDSEA
ncbi:adenylyltransferase/cytidyltransferase family protein [Psittacicella hinzii]|uniref:Cytidyltransferase-like domain-containing protein n=1 Tax=Psittacicella hinzii TaxID=2028575 RepID=A0A3A1YRV2_9GAMM|nr:adenylyltransferase/cytidyltransferase family protein [Psittacicella hinzii]RIY39979.1 hypothetical protein CKF58_01345 [Psittacicella hinzii]